MDPLVSLAADAALSALLQQGQQAIAQVHRRPVNLRRAAVTSSESVLRGARLAAQLWGLPESHTIDAYALLAPSVAEGTVRTFRRAPLQIFARLDVLLGGTGVPQHPERLSTLAQLITNPDVHLGLLPGVVHGELVSREAFGQRSGVVGWASARITALMGWDPRGLCVPEVYLCRHKNQYQQAVIEYQSNPKSLLELQLRAWLAGAQEAEGIARAAIPHPQP